MSTYEIPLTAAPQKFGISLNNVNYSLQVVWNTVAQSWFLDIADVTDKPIVQGIPLVTGADLLAQYSYLNFGGALVVQTENAPGNIPTYDNLGTDSHLYFITE